MSKMLNDQPVLYHSFFPAELSAEIPSESKATCANCAMCQSPNQPTSSPDLPQKYFRSDTKCCTYYPRLPNYLVGAILADDSAEGSEGRSRILSNIEQRIGSTPQWLRPPAKYEFLYNKGSDSFGRSRSLRCPYYVENGGQCSIWRYREAVCSTFFCKYVAGADGRAFWMSFKRYLSLVETQLTRLTIQRLFPELARKLLESTPSRLDGLLSARDLDDECANEEDYRETWGDWTGREVEFYLRCFEIVRSLTPQDFRHIMGLDGDLFIDLLQKRRADVVAPTLPKSPRLNPNLTVRHMGDGSVALGFHSEYEALVLPRNGFELLAEFRGHETIDKVRQRLRDVHHTDFDDELLVEFHRHRILI